MTDRGNGPVAAIGGRKRRLYKCLAIVSFVSVIVLIVISQNAIQKYRQTKKLLVLKEYSLTIDRMAEDIKVLEEMNEEFNSDIKYIQNEINSEKVEIDLSAKKLNWSQMLIPLTKQTNWVKTSRVDLNPTDPTPDAQVFLFGDNTTNNVWS